LKLLSECSIKEKKEHNIHEENNEVFVKIVNKTDDLKSISECSTEEKEKNGIVEKEGIFFVTIKNNE
jgi:hypothetical protein